MISYKKYTIEVRPDRGRFEVYVYNSRGDLIRSLPALTEDEALKRGKDLVDFRSAVRNGAQP